MAMGTGLSVCEVSSTGLPSLSYVGVPSLFRFTMSSALPGCGWGGCSVMRAAQLVASAGHVGCRLRTRHAFSGLGPLPLLPAQPSIEPTMVCGDEEHAAHFIHCIQQHLWQGCVVGR